MIGYNAVYQIEDDGKRFRIIDINAQNGICAYIPLDGDRTFPILGFIEDIKTMLNNKEVIEIIDPYYKLDIPDEYSEAETERCEERYQLVSKYWPSQKNELLQKNGRAQFLERIAIQEGVTVPTLKRLFCQFWQRGMRKSSMFTSYANSGGKGKNRIMQKKNGVKRADNFEGLIIDEKIENIFKIVIERYYETEKKPSLTRVYYQMLDKYFSKSVKSGDKTIYVLYDEDHYPTIRQFKYYIECHLNKQEAYIARETKNKYELKRRSLSDTTTNQIYGPGDCFMIDSTPADIYLVSKSNPNKVIGRPTVYIIIDVYSRLITGYYAGLENPSWDAVSISLQNMVADKVEYCREYDVSIEESDWPSQHLPQAILADRGDMISKRAQGIIKELSVIILNTAPYRGDMKGTVERFFRTMNEHLKETLPGGIHKDNLQRGDKDPHIEAALTLKEFQQILIQIILLHNTSVIKDYHVTPAQIEDGVPSTPSYLWEYGIQNITGNLRKVDVEKMSLNVWPHDTASLTRKGLRFKDLYYGDIHLAQKQSGLGKATKMKIIYNPFTVNYIFVLDGNPRKVYLQSSCDDFKNMSFDEYRDYRQTEKSNNAALKHDNNQRRATNEGMLLKIGGKAKSRQNYSPKRTKYSRKENIREERQNEKLDERRARTEEPSFDQPAKVIPMNNTQPNDYMDRMKDETAFLIDELFGDND